MWWSPKPICMRMSSHLLHRSVGVESSMYRKTITPNENTSSRHCQKRNEPFIYHLFTPTVHLSDDSINFRIVCLSNSTLMRWWCLFIKKELFAENRKRIRMGIYRKFLCSVDKLKKTIIFNLLTVTMNFWSQPNYLPIYCQSGELLI